MAFVESGGTNPGFFEQLIHHTLAVLDPAIDKRNEWRDQLIHI